MGILPKESWVVLEEEYHNNGTITEGVEGDYEGVLMDGEEELPDDLSYDGECEKNCCMNRENAENTFEANNCNISKVRSEIRNTIIQSKTKTKAINLSQTTHPNFRALNLRHTLDVHSKSTSQARWRQQYSQHQNRTAFCDIGGKTGQQRHWLMNNGGYSRS